MINRLDNVVKLQAGMLFEIHLADALKHSEAAYLPQCLEIPGSIPAASSSDSNSMYCHNYLQVYLEINNHESSVASSNNEDYPPHITGHMNYK